MFSRAVLAALLLLVSHQAHAAIGETLSDMRKRVGKAYSTGKKNVYVWYFEVVDGPLSYVVTFNAQDRSIAEGIRPVKRARLTPEMAENFISTQIQPLADSPSLRRVNPGEKYTFAGLEYTCNENDTVVVDDIKGILIVWTKAPIPTITVVSHEMLGYVPKQAAPAAK